MLDITYSLRKAIKPRASIKLLPVGKNILHSILSVLLISLFACGRAPSVSNMGTPKGLTNADGDNVQYDGAKDDLPFNSKAVKELGASNGDDKHSTGIPTLFPIRSAEGCRAEALSYNSPIQELFMLYNEPNIPLKHELRETIVDQIFEEYISPSSLVTGQIIEVELLVTYLESCKTVDTLTLQKARALLEDVWARYRRHDDVSKNIAWAIGLGLVPATLAYYLLRGGKGFRRFAFRTYRAFRKSHHQRTYVPSPARKKYIDSLDPKIAEEAKLISELTNGLDPRLTKGVIEKIRMSWTRLKARSYWRGRMRGIYNGNRATEREAEAALKKATELAEGAKKGNHAKNSAALTTSTPVKLANSSNGLSVTESYHNTIMKMRARDSFNKTLNNLRKKKDKLAEKKAAKAAKKAKPVTAAKKSTAASKAEPKVTLNRDQLNPITSEKFYQVYDDVLRKADDFKIIKLNSGLRLLFSEKKSAYYLYQFPPRIPAAQAKILDLQRVPGFYRISKSTEAGAPLKELMKQTAALAPQSRLSLIFGKTRIESFVPVGILQKYKSTLNDISVHMLGKLEAIGLVGVGAASGVYFGYHWASEEEYLEWDRKDPLFDVEADFNFSKIFTEHKMVRESQNSNQDQDK